MKISIEPGYVVLGNGDKSITQIVDTEFAKVFEIDLSTKYAVVWYTCTDVEFNVILDKDDNTIKLDETKSDATYITFTLDEPDWWIVVSATTRYTARVVLYKSNVDKIVPATLV